MPSGEQLLFNATFVLIPLLLSLTVHEWAHAWSAYMLGDDTAALQGRMTLNPIAHMDPIGTFLLPVLGMPFGWAKPVPVNPARFRRSVTMATGMVLTAVAGPLSNLVLAIVCTVVYGIQARFSTGQLHADGAIGALLRHGAAINVTLFLFNMLPIPPLDGSRLVDAYLPNRLRPAWEMVGRFSAFALLAFFFVGGVILEGPRTVVMGVLGRLFVWVAGYA